MTDNKVLPIDRVSEVDLGSLLAEEKSAVDKFCIDVVIPVYNSGSVVTRVVNSVLIQQIPPGWRSKIIIVDDGSSNGVAERLQVLFDQKIEVIAHKENKGRASACNTGWRGGNGCFMVFLDSDCEWLSMNALCAHLKMLLSGADVSCGMVKVGTQGFWTEYQNQIQKTRRRKFKSGNATAFTTANCAFRRSKLLEVDGFDECYRRYGFEDRDLLLRLEKKGARIEPCWEAVVSHDPDLSLIVICRKMTEAGRYSSTRFWQVHPTYYSRSAYGKVDCRLHGFSLQLLAMIAEPLVPLLARIGDWIIRFSSIPFRLKQIWVKSVSGLAYLVGTYRTTKERSSI